MPEEPQSDIRARIAEAGLRRVASGGIAALTMRTVAAEAGCSLGLVQRTVVSRAELLLACMERVIARVEERLEAVDFDALAPPVALAALIDILLADGGEAEGAVWLAFVGEAAVSPALRQALRRQEDEAENVFAALLGAGGSADAPDVRTAALSTLALVNGLGEQLALGRCSGSDARGIAHAHVNRLQGELELRKPPSRPGSRNWSRGARA